MRSLPITVRTVLVSMVLGLSLPVGAATEISIVEDRWHLNGKMTCPATPAEGLLMNVRMVNATFEDRNKPDFDPKANVEKFMTRIPDYVAHGVRAFTLCLQGGMPGYEGAVNSAFRADGSLEPAYLTRVRRVIEACDQTGAAVILGCYYQRQSKILRDEAAVRAGVVNAAKWIQSCGFKNVLLEVANEYPHPGFVHRIIRDPEGEASLIRLAKSTVPGLLVSASGYGNARLDAAVAEASDFLLIHFNGVKLQDIPARIAAQKKYKKPIVCNEDDRPFNEFPDVAALSVSQGCSHGLMLNKLNQQSPFTFNGAADHPAYFKRLKELTTPKPGGDGKSEGYFPPPDSDGGWRAAKGDAEVRERAGMNRAKLEKTFDYIQGSTRNGGLLVLRHGWLAYERYFGLGHHEAVPNLASCGKSFTSVAVGILLSESPEIFPDGLDQKIFTARYFPAEAFPLSDPRKADIKLGQLLAFSAGIRGNNPSYVDHHETVIDPPGPDGVQAGWDAVALGKRDETYKGGRVSTATLWCDPGEGYSYATSSIHLASIMLRHLTGVELQEYLERHLAKPLGWGRWGYGYKTSEEAARHTPGGGGIALRPTDMLRFGYLMLHEGNWSGRQLIPREYVRLCSRESPYNPHFPYSLQFNVNSNGEIPELPHDAFWKSGSGGHAIYIVPSLDLVVWKLGGRDEQYAPGNTGIPAHPDAVKSTEKRPDWREKVDSQTALRETLRRVVEAVEP